MQADLGMDVLDVLHVWAIKCCSSMLLSCFLGVHALKPTGCIVTARRALQDMLHMPRSELEIQVVAVILELQTFIFELRHV